MSTETQKRTMAAIGIAGLLFLGAKAFAQSNQDSTVPDLLPDTTVPAPKKTSVPATTKKTTVPAGKTTVNLWETWAKQLGGPVAYWKACYDSGIRDINVAQTLVVLRSHKDDGANRNEMILKYDDASRTAYLKWAVKKWAALKLKYSYLPTAYMKAFNQDLKVQYASIYNKVVPMIDNLNTTDVIIKPLTGLIGLL